ncbi:uncharacterized protein LOC144665890 isoform X2 [Oculina patagonica]
MERSFFLGIVIIIVLTTFATGSPIQEENDSNVMRRNSLLEKLGMELHRDPYYSPYKRRCYCGPRRRPYRRRKGRKGSGSSSSGSDSESGSPSKYRGYGGKYGKYGYGRYRGFQRRGGRSSDEE